MLFNAGSSEIIGYRSYSQDEIVVANAVTINQHASIVIQNWRNYDAASTSVYRFQRTVEKSVSPSMCVTRIANLVQVGVQ